MSSNPQASAISGAQDALSGRSFPTIAAAQEAAHKAILGKMSDSFDDARIRIEGDEQSSKAAMHIYVDPTDGEDDAFEITFIGTLGPHSWTFKYKTSDYITDKRG